MTLNTQKCKHIHIGRSEQHNNLVLKDQLDQDIQLISAEKKMKKTYESLSTKIWNSHSNISKQSKQSTWNNI